jgi:cytochrome b561
VAILIAVGFILWRVLKYKPYYKKQLRDWAGKVILLLHLGYVYLIAWMVLRLTISIPIVSLSGNQTDVFNCKIITDFTTNADRIMYSFKGRDYIAAIVHTQNTKDLQKNYYVRITVTPSIWGCYILQDAEILPRHNEAIDS